MGVTESRLKVDYRSRYIEVLFFPACIPNFFYSLPCKGDSYVLAYQKGGTQMKKFQTLFSKLLISTFMVLSIIGCTTTMSLYYDKPPYTESNRGNICVVVEDQRSPGWGGDEPMRVGTIRNGVGMPFALNASAGREPTKAIKELVSDCLKATGYNVSDQTESVPQIRVVIKEFWTDGYHHQRIWSVLPTQLKMNNQASPTWKHTFESSHGVTWTAGYGPFEDGINRMMEDLKAKMLTTFNAPEFNDSLKSL
jgi:hypothetical protein